MHGWALAAAAPGSGAAAAGSSTTTLVVAVTGIVVSGLLGPTVTALWTARRERDNAHRERVQARRDDLRGVLDEAARTLSGAVRRLRPAVRAEREGEDLPTEARDFLGELVPLKERIALRLGSQHAVVEAYETARLALEAAAAPDHGDATWDAAVKEFEIKRSSFLAAAEVALHAPIEADTQI